MNQLNKEMKTATDGFERAKKLREEAQGLEEKERIKKRLTKLMEISEDPYYDQYLNQMLKDLMSGKATPRQVEKEADRTYRLYLQRMGKTAENRKVPEQVAAVPVKQKDTVEFKIGAGIFSVVGAVFVLAALVILGFNFLEGIWQGICLYVVSLAVILISELIIKKLSRPFAMVITGIGISSLFISTVINYLVLKNINGLAASLITLVIALFSILFSKKKDAASIRLITIFGCYICFLPIKGFESELSFLVMTGMLLIINLASVFLPNQSSRTLISAVHIIAHTIFTGVVMTMVLISGMNIIYVAFFIITSLVLLNLIFWQLREDSRLWFTIISSVAIVFCAIYLVSIVASLGSRLEYTDVELFYKILIEIMAIAVAAIFFILWGKKKESWIQYYFAAAIVIFFQGFSDYKLETAIGILLLFVLTRLLSRKKEEVVVLDCILAIVTALQGLFMAGEWYVILFMFVMLLSLVSIKEGAIFHEVVVTLFLVLATAISWKSNWILPISLGILLAVFLAVNHLPMLKKQNQQPYNIFNITLAGIFSLWTCFCDAYWINSVAMLTGAGMIVLVFRKRYQMEVQRRYFILAGYLFYMIFAAHFPTPVIVSGLLMLVAAGCIGIGFFLKDKSYRICGLIMAVFVCAKMVLYDFRELESLLRAILFLLVGVIALIISFLYIYLEKKENRKEIQENSQTEQEDIGIVEERGQM